MLADYKTGCCNTVPLTKYRNNPVFQDMTTEDDFTGNIRDDKIYVDMRRSKGCTDELEKINRDDSGLAVAIKFKGAAAEKLRLRIAGNSQAEYWFILSNKRYVMSYKNYNISKADDN